MRIVIDENIAFAREAFSEFGKIALLPGRSITNTDLQDADALLVRSITNVNRELLNGTKVKFVGTATIGTDHIDKGYLASEGIVFKDAAGCNSYAVSEYVLTAVSKYLKTKDKKIPGMRLGIVGHGNIGTKIEVWAKALGFEVVINDPPKQREFPGENYRSLEEALECDIITFHVPLNKEGSDKTIHLLNKQNLNVIRQNAMLINSSRGPVVDNNALLNRLKTERDLFTVLDVWENEPNLNAELLDLVNVGTPHIAGYTLEGKVNGTVVLYDALCEFAAKPAAWKPVLPAINNKQIEFHAGSKEEIISKITEHVYNIQSDYETLKPAGKLAQNERGKFFDSLRKNYTLRRELNNYSVDLKESESGITKLLDALRLN